MYRKTINLIYEKVLYLYFHNIKISFIDFLINVLRIPVRKTFNFWIRLLNVNKVKSDKLRIYTP